MSKTLHCIFLEMASIKDPVSFLSLARQAMKEHGGLAALMQKQFGKSLEPYEMLSYMWEALQIAPFEYDQAKGQATTCLYMVTKRLVQRRTFHYCRIATVRIPLKAKKRFSKAPIESIDLDSYITDII